jgi:type IV fimbrial biogenesis protein FimT
MLGAKMKHHAGASLVEILIVVAIVGFLATIGLPSYNIWMQNARVRNAAESVLNGRQLARSEAVARNTQVNFVVNNDSSWTFGCANAGANCPAVIQARAASEGSVGATVVVNNAAVANTVAFNNLGGLVNAGGAMTVDVDSSVLSAADSRELQVQISAGGSVRLCDPNTGGTDPRRCGA